MRSGAARKGADYTGISGLADAADTELLLDGIENRADLLHSPADLLGVGLEGARPEVERLGLQLDLGRVLWYIHAFRIIWHSAVTAGLGAGSCGGEPTRTGTRRPTPRHSGSRPRPASGCAPGGRSSRASAAACPRPPRPAPRRSTRAGPPRTACA